MRKVFAVLLFLLLILSYEKSSSDSEKALPTYSIFKNNSIYTAPGDFDGDGEMESIFVTKPDEDYYISILDKANVIYKKLNYKADNLKLTIQDINNDNKEDIILNIIQNNCENCYVYEVDAEIITLLSPDLIKDKINSKSVRDYTAYECKNLDLPVMNNNAPDIRLYYTEMDYSGDQTVFISEGAVFDKNINILNLQIIVSIDKMGKIILRKINMLPVNN